MDTVRAHTESPPNAGNEFLCELAELTDALLEAGCTDGAVVVAASLGCDETTCWLGLRGRSCNRGANDEAAAAGSESTGEASAVLHLTPRQDRRHPPVVGPARRSRWWDRRFAASSAHDPVPADRSRG